MIEPATSPSPIITILFLAMEFPPVNTAGVFRSLKFTKYLPLYDVRPVVLTLEASQAVEIFGDTSDPALLRELPVDVKVVRVACGEAKASRLGALGRFLSIYFQIEDRIGSAWRKQLMERMPALVAEYRPQALYVSLPPFSAGRLAMTISRRYQLPLIVDMRDGWSHWRVGPYGSWLHFYLTARRERALFRAATVIVTVTRQLARMFATVHAGVPANRIQVITNGYDFDLDLPDRIDVPKRDESSRIVIGYTGSFYYEPDKRAAHFTPWWRKRFHRKLQYSAVKEDWLYRSPHFFMRALALLFDRRPDLRSRVVFEVIGSNAPWLTEMAESFGIAANCLFHGRGTQADVLQFQSKCDAFLCTSVKVPDGQDYAIASKTFDYLRYAKPILGFVTEGAQRDFLHESGMSLLCDPDNVDASIRVLEALADGGFSLNPNLEFLSAFHRKALAAQLADTIKNVAA